MQLAEVMTELERCGSEQTRRTYARHGVAGAQFGVKYGDLGRLERNIGQDHVLAGELWATGNHDARILACKIEDAAEITVSQANSWVRECDNYVLTEAVAGAIVDSPVALGRSEQWRDRKAEYTATAGWALVAMLASRDGVLSDTRCRELLAQIRREIADRPNRVRHEMNMALIAIGMRNDSLETQARKVASAIGVVDVDHGDTSCKTQDAAEYLDRVAARRAS